MIFLLYLWWLSHNFMTDVCVLVEKLNEHKVAPNKMGCLSISLLQIVRNEAVKSFTLPSLWRRLLQEQTLPLIPVAKTANGCHRTRAQVQINITRIHPSCNTPTFERKLQESRNLRGRVSKETNRANHM